MENLHFSSYYCIVFEINGTSFQNTSSNHIQMDKVQILLAFTVYQLIGRSLLLLQLLLLILFTITRRWSSLRLPIIGRVKQSNLTPQSSNKESMNRSVSEPKRFLFFSQYQYYVSILTKSKVLHGLNGFLLWVCCSCALQEQNMYIRRKTNLIFFFQEFSCCA